MSCDVTYREGGILVEERGLRYSTLLCGWCRLVLPSWLLQLSTHALESGAQLRLAFYPFAAEEVGFTALAVCTSLPCTSREALNSQVIHIGSYIEFLND